jgi:hypothetical protein
MNAKAEKVARMMGKTAYKDFRQGFASQMQLGSDSDADIKHALGIAQKMTGPTAVNALETYYGSTLMHEQNLRRAWDNVCGDPRREADYPIRRLGCSLAIREHAGIKVGQKEMKEWAWILHTNYEAVESAMQKAGAWLDDVTGRACRAFIEAMKEHRENAEEALKST